MQAKNFYEVETKYNMSQIKKKENCKDWHKGHVKDEHQILILNLFSSLQIINMINGNLIITLSMCNEPLLQNLQLLSPPKPIEKAIHYII